MVATLLSYHFTPIRHGDAPIRFPFSPNRVSFSCWTSPRSSPRSLFSPPRALLADSATVFRDAGATAAVMAGAYALVSAFDSLTQSNLIQQRDSPIGVIDLAMMCGGDSVADIIERRFGFAKLPYNEHKSWAGSIFMFSFGFLVSLGVALVSLLAAIVESLPVSKVIDDKFLR